jgi:hypothetical protein
MGATLPKWYTPCISIRAMEWKSNNRNERHEMKSVNWIAGGTVENWCDCFLDTTSFFEVANGTQGLFLHISNIGRIAWIT